MALRRPAPRLVIAVCAGLILLLAVIGLIRTVTADRGLTDSQYRAIVESGTLAGVGNDLTQGPGRPTVDLEQQRASYLGASRCTTYWTNTQKHLLSQTSHVPTDPNGSFVGAFGTELWDDPDAAQSALTDWAVCLEEYQDLSGNTSFPLKVVAHGTTAGVAWQYSESNDLTTPLRILVLRDRNLVTTFQLPDAPDPGWRTALAEQYHADVEAAARR